MAVHRIFLPGFVVMHPGMKTGRIEDVLAPLLLVRQTHDINDFDAHTISSPILFLESFSSGSDRVQEG
jgi:hypothetical protein